MFMGWVSGSPAPSFPALQGRAGRVRVSLLETVTVSSLAHFPHRCFPVLSAATQDLHKNTGYEVDDILMSTEHRSNFVGEDGKRPVAIGLLCAFARRERWARNEGHRVVVWLGRNQQPASHASSNAPPSRRRMLLKRSGPQKGTRRHCRNSAAARESHQPPKVGDRISWRTCPCLGVRAHVANVAMISSFSSSLHLDGAVPRSLQCHVALAGHVHHRRGGARSGA